MTVLGIETSCDDTSCALFTSELGVVTELTASQMVHAKYGGVVPELASRAHIRNLPVLFHDVLSRGGVKREDIDGIGVTNGPGLVGSLLVGVGFAKAVAFALGRPLVGVHHIEAHIISNELGGAKLQTPSVVLVVSGGHTSLYGVSAVGRYDLLGNTRDDAGGEAFDKIAKLLGLGYPGGPAIERAAGSGDPNAVAFPRGMMTKDNFDFSFSGLKTAVGLHVAGRERLDARAVADIAASAQNAIVDVLVSKTIACARAAGVGHVYLAGGVAANTSLRERLAESCRLENITYHAPLLRYCTDNAAMVACAASHQLRHGRDDGLDLDVFPRGPIASWA
jgi:N6-L-threonylcarbamoyladenine synthase